MFEIETGENNKILRKVCDPVEIFDEKLGKMVEEMVETMLHPDPETEVRGIGLAANQCGISRRILILTMNFGTKKAKKVVPMINPEAVELSKNVVKMEEGCLSLPGRFAKILRPQKVRARWQNLAGNWCEKRLAGWDARIFLHELDHLNGKLFLDLANGGAEGRK